MSRGSPREEFGPYLVYEPLGTGGMAEVHRAEQPGIEGFRKVVALKRMLPHVAANEDMVRSFVREARLASYLRHANVAQTYELGKVGDVYFIAMELVEGRSLREILKRCAGLRKRMPVPLALNILNQICDALDYAHNLRDHDGNPLGIVHRDVSPSNVIVAEDGVVKLIDFGIAKATAASMQTMSGTIKGKYGYMAPEYLAGSLDARADLFALGVIAHELLTNHPLFTTNDDIETLQRVRDMAIEPPGRINSEVPREIDDIVMTALERNPDRRWQQATALRAALTTLTHRLGMQVTNMEVVRWLDAMDFESTTLPFEERHPSAPTIGGGADSVVISIEQPLTVQLGVEPIVPLPPTIHADGTDPAYRDAVRQYERRLTEDEPTTVRPNPDAAATLVEPPPRKTLLGTRASGPQSSIPVAPAAPKPEETPVVVEAKPPAPSSTRLTIVLLVLLGVAIIATGLYFLLT